MSGSIEEFTALRVRSCSDALTYIESLKRGGVSFYVDKLEYTQAEAEKAHKAHRSTYRRLKNEGWPTNHIKSVARS